MLSTWLNTLVPFQRLSAISLFDSGRWAGGHAPPTSRRKNDENPPGRRSRFDGIATERRSGRHPSPHIVSTGRPAGARIPTPFV